MLLRLAELFSLLLTALLSGMYLAPWAALSRSMHTFTPEVFLAVVGRLNRNMAPVMTALLPLTLLSLLAVTLLAFGHAPLLAWTGLAALLLTALTLAVTMGIEVPIVQQIVTWTASSLPENWRQLRDRWGHFHLYRIVPAVLGLALLAVGVVFS